PAPAPVWSAPPDASPAMPPSWNVVRFGGGGRKLSRAPSRTSPRSSTPAPTSRDSASCPTPIPAAAAAATEAPPESSTPVARPASLLAPRDRRLAAHLAPHLRLGEGVEPVAHRVALVRELADLLPGVHLVRDGARDLAAGRDEPLARAARGRHGALRALKRLLPEPARAVGDRAQRALARLLHGLRRAPDLVDAGVEPLPELAARRLRAVGGRM